MTDEVQVQTPKLLGYGEQLFTWLRSVKQIGLICPICRGVEWNASNFAAVSDAYQAQDDKPQRWVTYRAACRGCGFVADFDAAYIQGILAEIAAAENKPCPSSVPTSPVVEEVADVSEPPTAIEETANAPTPESPDPDVGDEGDTWKTLPSQHPASSPPPGLKPVTKKKPELVVE